MTAPAGPGAAGLLVCAPLRIEAWALDRGPLRGAVLRTGMGPVRAAAALRERVAAGAPATVAVAGFAGGLDPGLAPGDVVVATRIGPGAGVGECPPAGPLAASLRRYGLRVHAGRVVSSDHVVGDAERELLARTGALAVDMESAALASVAGAIPLAVVRVVVDVPGHRWASVRTLRAGAAALRALRRLGPALSAWAAASRPAGPPDPHAPSREVPRPMPECRAPDPRGPDQRDPGHRPVEAGRAVEPGRDETAAAQAATKRGRP